MEIRIINDCATVYDLPPTPSPANPRTNEECSDFYLVPDMIWQPENSLADLVIDLGRRDLQCRQGLHSAVVICLFSDKRIPDNQRPVDGTSNRRGWHGDTYDIRQELWERDIGSYLWTLWRAPLTFETERSAERYARDALKVLIDQGVAAKIDVSTKAFPQEGVLKLAVTIFSRDGTRIYSQKFEIIWQQTRAA